MLYIFIYIYTYVHMYTRYISNVYLNVWSLHLFLPDCGLHLAPWCTGRVLAVYCPPLRKYAVVHLPHLPHPLKKTVGRAGLCRALVAGHFCSGIGTTSGSSLSLHLLYLWGVPEMEVPQNGWFLLGKIPLKRMIWGYPYFRNPPYPFHQFPASL